MTTLLQISDLHLAAGDALVSGRLDTQAAMARLVARITGILPRIGPVDGILISGDISDDGSADSYAAARTALAPLAIPVFVIPGNHDNRAAMRAAYGTDGYLPRTGPLNWHQSLGGVETIGLDTLVAGQGGGNIDAQTIDFLSDSLDLCHDAPVLLALHHPPFASGIAFMDRIGLTGTSALAEVLRGRDNEMLIVCGHIHCMIVTSFGGKPAMSAPSPCSSFAFDPRADGPAGYMAQADGFLLHRWQAGFRSVRIPIDAGSGPFPF